LAITHCDQAIATEKADVDLQRKSRLKAQSFRNPSAAWKAVRTELGICA